MKGGGALAAPRVSYVSRLGEKVRLITRPWSVDSSGLARPHCE